MPLEPDDFSRLYQRHAQGLLLFFQRRVHDPELAADLLAETFELAIRAGHTYRGSSASELSGWLWSIARNVLGVQERRSESERARAARLGRTPVTLSDREIERIEELAGLSELREAVTRRLSELPVQQREAVRLRVVEDLPYVQIAGRMNTTVEVARSRVSRGLRALNVALKDEHRTWRGE